MCIAAHRPLPLASATTVSDAFTAPSWGTKLRTEGDPRRVFQRSRGLLGLSLATTSRRSASNSISPRYSHRLDLSLRLRCHRNSRTWTCAHDGLAQTLLNDPVSERDPRHLDVRECDPRRDRNQRNRYCRAGRKRE